jgi:hypothetical protein
MQHAVQARALLVVGLDDRPGRIRGVGVEEHRLLRLGVVVPLVEAGAVDGAQLPLFQRVALAAGEAAALFLLRDREPVLVELDARAHEHALEIRRLAHELEVFVGLAEAHHPLHAGAVVPGPVIENDLARRRQVLHVALEIPLPAFEVGGLVERHHARLAGVQVLHEALDRAALAGRVAALEEHHEFLPRLRRPISAP